MCQVHVSMSRQSCANCLLTISPSVPECTVENSVAKALHFPVSLGKYLVFAMLAPGRISHATQFMCHCVEASRVEGFGFGQPDRNLSWEDYEYQHLWVDSPSSSLGWLYTSGLPVTNYGNTSTHSRLTQHSVGTGQCRHMGNNAVGKNGGLRWHKEKSNLCSWHKNSAYLQLVSPIQTSIYITRTILLNILKVCPQLPDDFLLRMLLCVPEQVPKIKVMSYVTH